METQVQEKKKVDFDLAEFSGDDRAEMEKLYEETLKDVDDIAANDATFIVSDHRIIWMQLKIF